MASTTNDSENANIDWAEKLQFFARHLVCLGGVYRLIDEHGHQVGPSQTFVHSGWILSIHGRWCLVTAGHVLKQLKERIQDRAIQITEWFLIDSFGPQAKHPEPIPLTYDTLAKLQVEDEQAGLDFALMALTPYYELALQKNGIVPVDERNWLNQHEVKFEHYLLLGIPMRESATSKVNRDEHQLSLDMDLRPYALRIDALENPPNDLPKTTYQRFIGKVDDQCTEEIMDGMSGGPIFGFAKDRYWIVAVQSSWRPWSKIVFGCPVPVFAGLIEKILSENE